MQFLTYSYTKFQFVNKILKCTILSIIYLGSYDRDALRKTRKVPVIVRV
jgi:hypothetical protein